MFQPAINTRPVIETFDEIVAVFGRAVLVLVERGRPEDRVITAVWALLMRSASAFRAIALRAAAGRLAAPRERRAARPETGTGDRMRRPQRPAAPFWARCRMWLLRLGRTDPSEAVRARWKWTGEPIAAGAGAALNGLVRGSAEMQALLRASPSARRIVRSMLFMSSDRDLHECLREPKRRRRPVPEATAEVHDAVDEAAVPAAAARGDGREARVPAGADAVDGRASRSFRRG